MTSTATVAVVGAGPYGLAAAAHLRRCNMPAGMLSPRFFLGRNDFRVRWGGPSGPPPGFGPARRLGTCRTRATAVSALSGFFFSAHLRVSAVSFFFGCGGPLRNQSAALLIEDRLARRHSHAYEGAAFTNFAASGVFAAAAARNTTVPK